MKTQVTVNGVTLSRAQVEEAYADLNPQTFPPLVIGGDLVEVTGGFSGAKRGTRGVVVGDFIRDLCNARYGAPPADSVRFTNGVDSWTVRACDLKRVGSFL